MTHTMTTFTRLLTTVHRARRLYWRLLEPTVVGVRALIVRDDAVMLVRHTYLPGLYLPGGKVDRGETALSACCREVAEECGLLVHGAHLVNLYSNAEQNRNDHIALFVVDRFEAPAYRPPLLRRLEIAESGFFPLSALPPDTTPATCRRLAEFRRARFDDEYW
jgi:ADP-ribose pyrophosphatase YjhB (NUDIX family)